MKKQASYTARELALAERTREAVRAITLALDFFGEDMILLDADDRPIKEIRLFAAQPLSEALAETIEVSR